jgi:hypothetical protein
MLSRPISGPRLRSGFDIAWRILIPPRLMRTNYFEWPRASKILRADFAIRLAPQRPPQRYTNANRCCSPVCIMESVGCRWTSVWPSLTQLPVAADSLLHDALAILEQHVERHGVTTTT